MVNEFIKKIFYKIFELFKNSFVFFKNYSHKIFSIIFDYRCNTLFVWLTFAYNKAKTSLLSSNFYKNVHIFLQKYVFAFILPTVKLYSQPPIYLLSSAKIVLCLFYKTILFIWFKLSSCITTTLYFFKNNFHFFFKTIFIFMLFYSNVWVLIHNFIFYKYTDCFFILDIDTYTGLFNIFLCFSNFDNLFLLIYLIFFEIGLSKYFYLNTNDFYFLVGIKWSWLYFENKFFNPNFVFLREFIVNPFLENILVYINNGVFEYRSTPIFFFFGLLFFTTVILSWFFFSYLGLYGIYKLNVITLFLFFLSLLLSTKSIIVDHKVYVIKLFNWVFLTLNVKVDCYFLIDTISFSFMLLTTTIAFFVYIYAFSYFRYEPLVDRFLLLLLSFVVSMLFLVTSGNTIMLFLGWELIGLTSFLLINFWTTKTATLKSAFKAFTFNKVSDFFMFMFLIASYSVFYTFDILSMNNQVFKYESLTIYFFGTTISFLEFLSFTIMGAAFIKSAQIGGHVWLPDSMEAPVPASALIHSATLVSAGIYLILRFNFIFDLTYFSKCVLPVIGSLTAAYGGICAAWQSDIKKTLAYSTISHCGFLMVLCSTEMNEFTILYLYVHGFFKAGVFMCVGNVLRISKGYQDTRRMGGLLKYLPFEYFCCVVGLLNLAGLPFTFGFFIKHLLLLSLSNHIYIYYFVIFNSLLGAFSGLFYSYRILTYTFSDFKKANLSMYLGLNKVNYNSKFYTNSSLASTLSIFSLFVSAYIITYFLFKYFLMSNYLFSDFMNTTLYTNYYSTLTFFDGFLLNFSYLNVVVFVMLMTLLIYKYRRYTRVYQIFRLVSYFALIVLFFILLYMFI